MTRPAWSLIAALGLALLALPGSARAEEGACGTAADPLDRMVCDDPELTRLAGEEARLYAEARRDTLDAAALWRDRDEWRRLAKLDRDPTQLTRRYAARIAALRKTIDAALPIPERFLFRADLPRKCLLQRHGVTCRVVKSGDLTLGQRAFAFATYAMPNESQALAIFEQSHGETLRAIIVIATSGLECEAAHVTRGERAVLVLPCSQTGSLHLDYTQVFAFDDAVLHALDIEDWGDFRSYVPDGYRTRKGIAVDFERLTATTPLWLDRDPDCCASGGTADLTFRWDGDRLRLDGVTLHLEDP